MSFRNDSRFSIPLKKETALRDAAASGDMVLVCTPATATPVPTSAVWTRDVLVSLKRGNGDVHTWFNKTVATGVSIADTSTAGTASIPSTSLIFKDGQVTVTVSGDAEDWLNTETDTLTVAELVVLGYTLTAKTSVETFTTA